LAEAGFQEGKQINKRMRNILIASKRGDTDSMNIVVALESKGHRVLRWVGDNYPSRQTASIFVSNNEALNGQFVDGDLRLSVDDIDVVWLRRPRWPSVPDTIHPDDKEVATQECKMFVQSAFQAAWQNAVWVNPLDGKRKASSKILQLQLAAGLGFNIPDTLITNNPADIRKFIHGYPEGAIAKPLLGGYWSDGPRCRANYTFEVTLDILPKDPILQACPCIYQRKIKKAFEVRATFFGSEVVAVRLDSQLHVETSIDWRIGDPSIQSVRNFFLPLEIREKCRNLMLHLGIVHGSFDFAIDENNDWIFFELNEAGQFLWIEHYVPEIPVLEIAAQFLELPSIDFRVQNVENRISLSTVNSTLRFAELCAEDTHNCEAKDLSAIL
jgi:glutathione synthase/RimK-type ligase-like ATP-grasp enzyme